MSAQDVITRAEALLDTGEGSQAEALLRSAAAEFPADGAVNAAWSRALRFLGRFSESEAVARRACALNDAPPEAWFNLGGALAGQARWPEAIDAYRQALALRGAYPEAWNNLALAFGAIGSDEDGIAAFERALEINSELAPVWSNLGEALFRAHQYTQAADACRRAIELEPGFAGAWVNLGNALRELGQSAAALQSYDRALAIDDGSPEAWSGRGAVLHETGDDAAAETAHRRAIAIAPDLSPLYLNYGSMLGEETRLAERLAAFRKALEIDPGFADAEWNLGVTLLSVGRLEEGWPHYGSRWEHREAEPMRHMLKPWSGAVRPGMKLFVWGEQGVGDEILYAGMLPALLTEGVTVTLECDPRLKALFARSFPAIQVVQRETPSPVDINQYNAQCPLADLAARYRKSFDAFPRHNGYLKADPVRVAEMRSWIERRTGTGNRVMGISWLSKNRKLGESKTLTLDHLESILRVPGITWVNLQYGDVSTELGRLAQASGIEVLQYPGLDTFVDIDGVAALVAACDRIITVSNVTAHIAGALGKPVWQMLPRDRGRMWYWFFGRTDSPWYPSMRVFSQHTPGEWDGLVGEVTQTLQQEHLDRTLHGS